MNEKRLRAAAEAAAHDDVVEAIYADNGDTSDVRDPYSSCFQGLSRSVSERRSTTNADNNVKIQEKLLCDLHFLSFFVIERYVCM